MIDLAHAGKGMFAPLYSSPPTMKLHGEQAEAARHVLLTNDQLSVILGSAGTGKTTLMQETAALINKAGKEVIAVAPTAQARDVLRKEGFENAETVAKLLVSPMLQNKLKDQILWVDEAGLLGLKDMTALLDIARKQNARIILGGDYLQNNSVAFGRCSCAGAKNLSPTQSGIP
jgi:ATP-dependent exoDNAse (exonuclease V) alpha subunit